jgi:hypothetical protein
VWAASEPLVARASSKSKPAEPTRVPYQEDGTSVRSLSAKPGQKLMAMKQRMSTQESRLSQAQPAIKEESEESSPKGRATPASEYSYYEEEAGVAGHQKGKRGGNTTKGQHREQAKHASAAQKRGAAKSGGHGQIQPGRARAVPDRAQGKKQKPLSQSAHGVHDEGDSKHERPAKHSQQASDA